MIRKIDTNSEEFIKELELTKKFTDDVEQITFSGNFASLDFNQESLSTIVILKY